MAPLTSTLSDLYHGDWPWSIVWACETNLQAEALHFVALRNIMERSAWRAWCETGGGVRPLLGPSCTMSILGKYEKAHIMHIYMKGYF